MPDDVLGIFSGSFQSFRAVILDGGLALARHSAAVYWPPPPPEIASFCLIFLPRYWTDENFLYFWGGGGHLKIRLLLAVLFRLEGCI